MTGRQLIIYILENGLEDKEVFSDGKVLGYLTVDEAAKKTPYGTATIVGWIHMGLLENCIRVNDEYLIPEPALEVALSRINKRDV